ncbi:hypothetical protein Airi01_087500 [Actinoallomurus iriomotensis]|uniref:Uncharacterized protein n=1 Tax=Actinoallomurus iriomotensis TaxID=478107 RepID=A0A9W6VPY9_9ACTN|nr:hypothetical protein Airi01_087500 [Actinoallomurus iriomotensis]
MMTGSPLFHVVTDREETASAAKVISELMADEDVLQDAPHRRVVRLGDTVRRPTHPWTPAVHALLGHLEQVGSLTRHGCWGPTRRVARSSPTWMESPVRRAGSRWPVGVVRRYLWPDLHHRADRCGHRLPEE